MNLTRSPVDDATVPAAASLAVQPSRRAKLTGIVIASLLFMAPLLMLPYARTAQADAWRPLGLRGETILALTVTSNEGSRVIYAETHTGLWRHTTGTDDTTWERIDAGLPVGPLGGPALAAWQVVPGRPLQIYALIGAGTARQIYRSDDGGRSWMGSGLAPGQTAHPAMIVLPGLGGAPDQIMLVTGSRAQRSSDGGATWAPGGPWPDAETRLSGEAVDPVNSLLVDPSAPERLFAQSREAALWTSENGGLSWRPSDRVGVTAVAITPYFGIRVWAATADALALSTDAGASWTEMPLPAVGARIVALRSDLRVPETLYAALANGAVARSDDSGLTWSDLGRSGAARVTVLALDPDLRSQLYAATEDGVWARAVVPPQPALIPTPSETAPLPTATITASPSPTASATASATPSPTASQTATPTASRTATPTRKPTLRPTATRPPTAIPTVVEALPTATAINAGGSPGGAPPPTAPPVETSAPPTQVPPR